MYDPECLKLAQHFLADEHDVGEREQDLLAQHIQTAIEDWLHGYEEDRARDQNQGPEPGDTP
jgi:hypothetical protein